MYFYAARQPILDREKKLFAYELLFRDSLDNVFPNIDENEATTKLIEGSQLGLDDMTGDKPAFINFTLDTLQKRYATMLNKEQVVVEILETVQPGKRLLAIVKELKELGYTLALDDYIHNPVWKHFYPYIDIIKIDFLEMATEEIKQVIKDISPYKNIKFLAEKVETYEQYQSAMDMGFAYFQGYFFSKPEVIQSKSLAPSQITLAELLYETSKSEMDLKKISEVFQRDVNLAYKLLRYTNSAAFNRRAEIGTIKQALVVLGLAELKKFLSVLFTAQVASTKPPELMRLSLTRARFAECLAIKHGHMKDTAMAFLAGMFSLIDGILDQNMSEILDKLPLSIEIKDAILKKEGLIADYLSLVEHYELADWEQAKMITEQLNIDVKTVPDAYHDAVYWANTQMEAMSK
ncbi:EAL domain-containing protein [Pseudoalteromonas sp. NBT06-2]|uniref:EAL and HDOD domain-containing protein n=1 Tax=Pseudoalteromonas sp. NBT06-2 TaxID=2025950 RepID=UPI000BA74AB0|nr:HDOD domain-containing protein [Pseudoalteromonas sp. NBT06-2]PAJ74635.1 EAL domain-containing protein [Pseudoalteromonas sp. NBT06-2]